ncbi:MAG: hypothetical protein BJBARM4_0852 [Candidatus Parvarchaeum acidiphilum ARMAN-4]|jgi:hypothetical protein|uniref:Uncharacterized protein n=1 Tax=Candidatus Parvarchaeum acidiphilum ARMAN-4 TaxID=662760 RepID=D2EGF3_PARA4|nr:MAG: hypothetical protein BJBARM4_0852 [Candidatus Parvarchaeum acidiphilum ARMAN-4]
MILEIEGIIALISGVFVLFSLFRFIHYFNAYRNAALYRIKLSKNVVNYFIMLLSANFILIVTYSFAAGPNNIKYGIIGTILYSFIFGLFFLYLSYAIEGGKDQKILIKKLN